MNEELTPELTQYLVALNKLSLGDLNRREKTEDHYIERISYSLEKLKSYRNIEVLEQEIIDVEQRIDSANARKEVINLIRSTNYGGS